MRFSRCKRENTPRPRRVMRCRHCRILQVAPPECGIFLVVADLNGSKDTIKMLSCLNECFPGAKVRRISCRTLLGHRLDSILLDDALKGQHGGTIYYELHVRPTSIVFIPVDFGRLLAFEIGDPSTC